MSDMSDTAKSMTCAIWCWVIAGLAAILSMAILYLLMDLGGIGAVFLGLLVGLLVGVVLSLFFCRKQTAAADLAAEEKPAQRYAREAAEDRARREGGSASAAAASSHTEHGGAAASDTKSASDHAEAASHTEDSGAGGAAAAGAATPSTLMSAPAGAVKPSQSLPGQDELASRKGAWKYESGGAAAGSVDKSKAIPAGETAAPAAEPDAEATAASRDQADATPVTSAHVEESKPETLYTSPPAEGADDLKLISGVGPKLEQTLNELGIYRFEQVAAWGPSDIAWVDNRLRFKGRIERDNWMGQARILADGGETEFSARKKK